MHTLEAQLNYTLLLYIKEDLLESSIGDGGLIRWKTVVTAFLFPK